VKIAHTDNKNKKYPKKEYQCFHSSECTNKPFDSEKISKTGPARLKKMIKKPHPALDILLPTHKKVQIKTGIPARLKTI